MVSQGYEARPYKRTAYGIYEGNAEIPFYETRQDIIGVETLDKQLPYVSFKVDTTPIAIKKGDTLQLPYEAEKDTKLLVTMNKEGVEFKQGEGTEIQLKGVKKGEYRLTLQAEKNGYLP